MMPAGPRFSHPSGLGTLGVSPTENDPGSPQMSMFAVTDASQVFNLTDAAVGKVAELMAAEETTDDLVLRVAVRPGGCSGYSYEMFFDTDVSDDDSRVEYGAIAVVVDSASRDLLKGATLDYKDGLQGAGFHIDNPNASRSCGCGQSFS